MKTFYGIADKTHGGGRGGKLLFFETETDSPVRGPGISCRFVPIYPFTSLVDALDAMNKHYKPGEAYIVSVEHDSE